MSDSQAPTRAPPHVEPHPDDETRETLRRIEGTLNVFSTALLELSGRVGSLEKHPSSGQTPAQTATNLATSQAVYPPPYQGPERRREPQPSFTSEAIVSLKKETEFQTPILQSIVPIAQRSNDRQLMAIIAIVVQTVAMIAYAITHNH